MSVQTNYGLDGGKCVGFVECPCSRCRRTRFEATEQHPRHERRTDEQYCGACRTAERRRHEVLARIPSWSEGDELF